MKSSRIAVSILALVSTLAVAVPTVAEDTYEPVGTVRLTKTEVGFIISVGGGEGVLKFEGQEYPFRIGGLGVGGVGIHGVTASGNVYNLDSVSDFEGTYGELRGGITLLGAHAGATKLENGQTGAVMTLKGDAEGIRLNIGIDGVRIRLE